MSHGQLPISPKLVLISSLSDTVFKRKHKNKVQKVKCGLVCVLSAHGKPQTSLSTLAVSKKMFSRRTRTLCFLSFVFRTISFCASKTAESSEKKEGENKREGSSLCRVDSKMQKKNKKKKRQRDLLAMTVEDNGCSKETVWFFMKRAFLLYTCTLSHRNGCGSPSRQGWAASPPPPALLADRDHGAGR